MNHAPLTRRQFLASSAALTVGGWTLNGAPAEPKRIAAVVTEFRYNSHAEVIVGRWLEGYELDGMGARPRSQLVALFTDQVPANDISRKLADKHKIPIFPTIRETLCLGGERLAVDGVLLIGEHGNYPLNDKGQKLYPRRRFLEETARVFRAAGRSVPVFNDKHLAYNWENAKWMYDQAVELKIPFMAGSSGPTSWRLPGVELAAGSPVEEGLSVGYGGHESYGFHALEWLQCLMERRQGGETGVVAVTCLEGPAVWQARDKVWSDALLKAAVATATEPPRKAQPEDACKNPLAFVIEYQDGRRATVLMLSGYVRELLFAARVKGRSDPFAVNCWLQPERPFGHFTMLAQGIDAMFQTGKPQWPVERTLLTTGILDAALTSRFEGHQRLETPQLAIAYQPGPAWKQPPLPRTGPRPPL
ncbi:MAG: hypothetical protein ACK4RK_01400 [Gemmataceae bacterium]